MEKHIIIPDLGGAEGVTVIELLVQPGQTIVPEAPLLTLEGDKATMEVPAPFGGCVQSIAIKVGDTVSEGDVCMTVTTDAETSDVPPVATPDAATALDPDVTTNQTVCIPDIGGADGVAVIEILVQVGDAVVEDQPLVTLEGDKATMEVPSPFAGQVTNIALKVGDTVQEGHTVLSLATVGKAAAPAVPPAPQQATAVQAPSVPAQSSAPSLPMAPVDSAACLENASTGPVYAGPVVRRYANVYGVDLTRVRGSGQKGRITKDDVTQAIRAMVHAAQTGAVHHGDAPASQPKPAPAKEIDFSRFGPVTPQPMSKIKQRTGTFLSTNWQTIPHVTQQDSADITALETYRKSLNSDLKAQGIKLSPLVFMMKAVAACLKRHPTFNASLSGDGTTLVLKSYCHLGVAVETPNGLVVPVIRDVDQKDLVTLSQEVVAIAEKARTKGLAPKDMQGGCFTISSLGGIGGQHFTPIVNAPEVAILGVSRARQQPTWQGEAWLPTLQVPLSLSYDHRVIDGADGARFITDLVATLADMDADIFQVQTPIHSTEE